MKFKKTKLTALALSVLMAASTITSVTWAADLFTDGAEVIADVTSDMEVVDVSENAPLLKAGGTVKKDLRKLEFYIDYNDVANPVKIKFEAHYVDEEGNEINGGTWLPEGPYNATKGSTLPADCENPERAVYEYKNENGDGQTYTSLTAGATLPTGSKNGYIPVPGGAEALGGHKLSEGPTIPYVVNQSTCKVPGKAYYYQGCVQCKSVYYNGQYYKLDEMINGEKCVDWIKSNCVSQDLPLSDAHTYGNVIVVTKEFADANSQYIGYAPVNCSVDANENYEVTDKNKDAYYYKIEVCAVCGKVKATQRYVQYRNDIDAGFYYKAGGNIKGFVVLYQGKYQIATTDNLMTTDGLVKAEYVKDIALENCKQSGTYYIREYQDDGTIVDEDKETVEAGHHAWGNVRIETRKDKWNTETQMDLLLLKQDKTDYTDPDNYATLTDANGDVIEAFSNNCTKEAKYALCRPCLSCGKTETYGETKVAPKSTTEHVYSPVWTAPDNDETQYIDLGDGVNHIKILKKSTSCERCGKKLVEEMSSTKEAHGNFADKKIEGTEVPATCGATGSYKVALTCDCGYIKEESITTTTIPATDEHDFGTNEEFIEWKGEIYIDDPKGTTPHTPISREMKAYVVRKCNVCGLTDSNGIDTIVAKPGGIGDSNKKALKIEVVSTTPAKKDPTTGVTYSCSSAHAKLYVEWYGTVDGKASKKTSTLENVPYYESDLVYQGTTAHQAGDVEIEKEVAATTEKEGSYDKVIYCKVCHDEMSRETVTVPKLDPEVQVSVPTVTATAVNYNTVNVSWTPVEGATSYRLYYRSADLGITTWHRVRTLKGTSFTHSGLTTGARYRYTVRAEVNGKLGDYSKTGSVARPLPAAPEMKSVTAVSNGTKVTWSKVDGADGYIIFRKTTGAFTRVGAVSRGSKVTWTDKKPVSGATYKVRAYRTVNNVNYKGAFSAAK